MPTKEELIIWYKGCTKHYKKMMAEFEIEKSVAKKKISNLQPKDKKLITDETNIQERRN
jgi:hypothetical protein